MNKQGASMQMVITVMHHLSQQTLFTIGILKKISAEMVLSTSQETLHGIYVEITICG